MIRLSSINSWIQLQRCVGITALGLLAQVSVAQNTKPQQAKPVLPNTTYPNYANTKTVPNDNTSDIVDVDIKLPTLEQLTELAIQKSEVLKQKDLQLKTIDEQRAMHKKSWLNIISMGTSFSAGNQSVLVQQSTGSDLSSNISNGYRFSLGANVSLYNVLTRRNTGKMLEYDKQNAELSKTMTIDDIKRSVISQYYGVINARDVLKVAIQNKITSEINKQMAEKDFAEGQIAVTDMSQVISAHATALMAFENAKQNFMTSIRYLELLVGQRLY